MKNATDENGQNKNQPINRSLYVEIRGFSTEEGIEK